MEKFISEEKTVTKYVHEDGSETAIKHWCFVNTLKKRRNTAITNSTIANKLVYSRSTFKC